MSRGVVLGLAATLVSIIALVVGFYAYLSTSHDGDETPVPVQKTTASGLHCTDGYDKILEQALAADNVEYCTCEDDAYAAELCTIAVTDAMLYQNAVSQLDERLCADIVELSRKSACEQVIASSVVSAPPLVVAETRRQHNDVRAIPAFEAILEEKPDDVSTMLELAVLHAEKGLRAQEAGESQVPEVEKALAYIDAAKTRAPELADVYETAGYVYEILPDYAQATAQYQKAIALDPSSVDAYVGYGHTANLQGFLEEALTSFLKARTLDTNQAYPAVYAHLCRLQSTRSDLYDEAKNNCRIVLDIPQAGALNHAEAHQTLAKIALREGDAATARTHYEKALVLTPTDSNLLTALADYEISIEQYDVAEEYARKAIAGSPAKAVPHLSLAYALYQQERFAEAIIAAETGLGLIDDDVSLLASSKEKYRREFYYTLANIYYYTGDKAAEHEYKTLGDALGI
ncbi:MAG: tetratricopeptide repeat protein [Candidatus Pacebacteria bacterium]|nr:tetratricopeptide repeat protein [Candidatus Paceibacterota bacterium]